MCSCFSLINDALYSHGGTQAERTERTMGSGIITSADDVMLQLYTKL